MDEGRFSRLRAVFTPERLAFVFVLWVYWQRFRHYTGWRVGGDGFYSWIFARSMAFDGDLHFANDYQLCGDPWGNNVVEGAADGRPANPFYIGPALLWAPLLFLLRKVTSLPPGAPATWINGCEGLLAERTLLLAPLCGTITCWIGYRAARRYTGEGGAIASMLAVAFCTPLTHFATLIAVYSHVWAAFGVAVAMHLWLHAMDEPTQQKRWFLAGMGVGFAALMRVQAGIMLLPIAIFLGLRVLDEAREKRFARGDFAAGIITLLGFMSLFWIQLVTYKLLYGRWWVVPQGRAYLQLGHSHPWLTLFAGRSGFFSWHPMHWLGAIGLLMLLRKRETRVLGVGILIPFMVDVYLNGAAYWHAGASFGARRLTTAAAPWVLTGAVFLRALWDWLQARPWRLKAFATVGWLLPWVVINFGASSGNADGRVSYNSSVPGPELYSTGARISLDYVYQMYGNPFSWPAQLLFSARYQLHPRKFDGVSSGGYFQHGYRPVVLQGQDTVHFRNPSIDDTLIEGLSRDETGVLVRARERGRMLVELGFYSVTHVRLHARPSNAQRPVRLRVSNGSFWRRVFVADVSIPAEGGVVEFACPAGAFDSGINELLFESDGDVRLFTWQWIDRATHDSSIR